MQDLNGNTYRWVRIDTLDWMAENLRAGTRWYRQGSKFSWADSTECANVFAEMGNYYSLSEALAQCPDGWRLPTDDDWKSLERACGMSREQAEAVGWRKGAGRRLVSPETIGLCFGGELAAYYTAYVELYHPYEYGLYWSQTPASDVTSPNAYIRKVTPALDEVQRIPAPATSRWLSVRYVRTAK